MKVIIIKTKYPSNLVMVDDSDYDELMKYTWHIKKISNNFYAFRWVFKDGKRKPIYMHRHITKDFKIVDHIDRNGLNNQRNNLRDVTTSQNIMNTGVRKDNSTGFKGVHYSKERKKYVAQIVVNGKNTPLGRYDQLNDAISAYNNASMKYRGFI